MDAYIRIKGKRSRKDRIIPLNDKAQQAINAYLAGRPETGHSILFVNRFGKPCGDRGVQKMLRKYLKQAGIEKASVHTLRHTFGIHYAGQSTSIKTLQEIMGHNDIRSTSIYLSLVKENNRQ